MYNLGLLYYNCSNIVPILQVCFGCNKVKFSFFGQRATTCKFCQRNVCSRCSTKVGQRSNERYSSESDMEKYCGIQVTNNMYGC